nr:papilin-like [Drosophila takahashii]
MAAAAEMIIALNLRKNALLAAQTNLNRSNLSQKPAPPSASWHPIRATAPQHEVRWYYNSQLGLCDEFPYTGCGGNANNYASEEECQRECHDVQNTCALPPVQGRCSESYQRWFFDERSGGCHEFEFTGCRGNRNNFESEGECLSFCRSQESEEPAEPQPPAQLYSRCDAPPVFGDCDSRISAWFYDKSYKVCTIFTYSGCGGNGNRFETRDQCERQCKADSRLVDVHAALHLDWKNSYTAGSTISMVCSVQGYPEPDVTWAKDEVPLYSTGRIQITFLHCNGAIT